MHHSVIDVSFFCHGQSYVNTVKLILLWASFNIASSTELQFSSLVPPFPPHMSSPSCPPFPPHLCVVRFPTLHTPPRPIYLASGNWRLEVPEIAKVEVKGAQEGTWPGTACCPLCLCVSSNVQFQRLNSINDCDEIHAEKDEVPHVVSIINHLSSSLSLVLMRCAGALKAWGWCEGEALSSKINDCTLN